MQVWTMVCGHTCAIASGQAREAVADDHEYVGDTPVLQLGAHGEPVLRALTAVAGPQAEDVASRRRR